MQRTEDELVDEALARLRPRAPAGLTQQIIGRTVRRRRSIRMAAAAACLGVAVGWLVLDLRKERPRQKTSVVTQTLPVAQPLDRVSDAVVPIGKSAAAAAADPRTAPHKGAASPRVTLVVFTDYECPFCARFEATLGELLARYPQDLRLVMRQLPLGFHRHAALAAEAALQAHHAGRFWPMHEKLMGQTEGLDQAALRTYARLVGLDVPAFSAALRDRRFRPAVERDQALAAALGINGTPTSVVVAGQRAEIVSGALPLERMVAEVQRALDEGSAPAHAPR